MKPCRVLAKPPGGGRVVRAPGLLNEHAVDVEAERRHGARAPGVELRDGAGVVPGPVEEGLRNARFAGPRLGGDELFVAPEDVRGVDHFTPAMHGEPQGFERRDDPTRGFKFAPAFFRAAVERAAHRDGFRGMAFEVLHGSSSPFCGFGGLHGIF